jgi:hypothetical protein
MLVKKHRWQGLGEQFAIQFLANQWGSQCLDSLLYDVDPSHRPSGANQSEACFDRAVGLSVRRKSLLPSIGGGFDHITPLQLIKLHVKLMELDAKRAKSGKQPGDSPEALAAVDGLLGELMRLVGKPKPCKDRSGVRSGAPSAEKPKHMRARAD